LAAMPGAKLGLANIVTMVTLALFPRSDAWKVVGLRVFLGSLLAGTLLSPTFLLSAAGAIGSVSAMMMTLSASKRSVSVIGTSIIGAVAHNTAQLLMAIFLARNVGLLFYLPYLLVFGLPTGYFIGTVSGFILRRFFPVHSRLESTGYGGDRQDLICRCRICNWSPQLPKED
jgi:heptaprenyl diphosphate synthase